nr:MAG TPA: hypothetical protein [Caudoviricetes sp.]
MATCIIILYRITYFKVSFHLKYFYIILIWNIFAKETSKY